MRVGYCKVYRSCFRTFGAKVLEIFVLMIRQFHRNESSWNVRSRGMKVPREWMFHGTKVLGYRSESSKERMFHGTNVPRERKFSLWSFRSRERKCRGTKRPGILTACRHKLLLVSALWDWSYHSIGIWMCYAIWDEEPSHVFINCECVIVLCDISVMFK